MTISPVELAEVSLLRCCTLHRGCRREMRQHPRAVRTMGGTWKSKHSVLKTNDEHSFAMLGNAKVGGIKNAMEDVVTSQGKSLSDLGPISPAVGTGDSVNVLE